MESGTATTPEWVASELLVQFLDDLRDAGYNIGIQQYIAVQDLVLTLATQGELPDLRNLRSFIGPIVCSSAIEQIDFQERFDGWTKQLNLDDFRQLNLEDFRRHEIPEHNAKSLVEDLDRIQRGGKTLTRLLTGVVIICAVLLFPSHKLQKDIPLSHSTSTPLPEPTSATRPSNAPQPSEVPSPQPSEVPSPQPSEVPSLQPSEVPDPFSLETPLPPSSMVKNERFQWRAILFFGVVVATLLIWRFWWYRSARQFLNRRESNHSPELQKLSMQGIESSLFSSNLVFQTAQQLRRRTRQFANTLDIQQTLLASIKQGGWLTPIYCTKKTIPEYLFLIDRASYADHQAKLTEELIQQLQQNGVYIKRFFFDEDAQVCYPELQSHYPQSLQDLFSQYGRDRLVIVVEAEILFSHQTGKPKTWLDLLQAWEQRVLLTPNPVESWSQWELNLMQKFIVLPLTPQGIAAFPQIFLKGSTVYRLAETPSTPFPEMLAIRSQQWLGRYPPRAEKGQQMLSELATYLEESGLYWFAACAVFPELHWTITVYLGNVLKNTEGRALLSGPILSKLVRLPWFRYGYIPDWLRRYLVLNLTPDQNKAVRQAFRQLMVMAVRGDIGPLQLEIAQQYQQTLPNLTRPLLRLLSRQTSDEAPLRDFIFLDFMTKESLLTVAIPEDLKPLFHGSQYEKILRRQKLRLTVVIGFIFVSVGLYAWWTITAPTRHMNQLLHDARALTVANNHLDALVMLTQVGQMLRASNNQDSTILSSTTSLFLKNVSIRNNAVSSSPPSFHQHNQLNSHQAGVISVVFSPDGNTLISASEDNTIKLWDRSGKLLNSLKEHTDTVYSVAFSPDRNTLTSASRNGTIKLWDRSEELLNSLKGHIDTGYSVAFSPDRNTLASVSEDNTIKLWDRSGKLLNSLKGHTDTVISVAFSPDGNILASASEDNTIKLWDRSGKLLNTLKGHTTAVNNVAFSPDGNILASASSDTTIKLWPWSIDLFVAHSCNWLKDYLLTNPNVSKEDKELCGL
ncbi:hypothetical protein [Acaryochloris sp. IP29b_bin.137]|uniref:WD40 domain-containing protein n=1 Tax=Acaryochloris sp. IP29b_bin.137 TaxID=2969217 RepID=UPI00261C6F4A|nr:hypothetical protein [Acaryochloris sp. IP29b_bin.137]